MLTKYVQAALRHAHYEIIDDPEPFYGSIPECQGVWANAKTLEECRDELESVLEDWILFRVSRQLTLPQIDGLDLSIREVA